MDPLKDVNRARIEAKFLHAQFFTCAILLHAKCLHAQLKLSLYRPVREMQLFRRREGEKTVATVAILMKRLSSW